MKLLQVSLLCALVALPAHSATTTEVRKVFTRMWICNVSQHVRTAFEFYKVSPTLVVEYLKDKRCVYWSVEVDFYDLDACKSPPHFCGTLPLMFEDRMKYGLLLP